MMVKHLILIITYLFFLFGCDSSTISSNDEISNNTTFENKDLVLSMDTSIIATDTISNQFDAKPGDAFIIEIIKASEDFEIDFHVLTPGSKELSSRKIVVEENGVYQVLSYLQSVKPGYSGDISYSVKITKSIAIPDSLNGLWIMVEEKYSFNGETVSFTYNENSAEKVLLIEKDSITDFYYDSFSKQLNENYTNYKALSYYFINDVSIKDGYIICSNTNGSGSEYYKFKKFTDTLDDIVWAAEKNITVPLSMQGDWYLTYEYELEMAIFWNEKDSSGSMYKYNSASESRLVMSITEDSIITYINDIGGGYERNSEPVSENYWFFKESTLSDDTLKVMEVYYESENQWYEAEHEEECYLKYGGPMPPEEWK